MVRHHAQAVAMADLIIEGQQAEVDTLRTLLAR